MTVPDAAFLEEVDEFLVSFDLPAFPTLHSLTDSENSDEALPLDAFLAEKEAPKPVDRKRSRKKTEKLDPAAKRELEKEKDRKRRTTYRERRRVEKETLQQQVGELSTQLTELESAKQAERSLMSSAWEMVSKRQLQARVNAEERQRRLIQAIETRAALIQDVQGVLHDRLGDTAELCPDEAVESSYKQKRIRLEPSDAEFYEVFFRDLDANFAEADAVLQTYGLESTDAEWSGLRQQWKQQGDDYHVFTDKHVLPFDFRQVSAVTWRAAEMHHRQEDRQAFEGVKDPENTAAFKFRITTRLKSGRTVSVLQRAASRQYKEGNRSMILWRTFTEGEGMFTGMNSDACGWCIATPLSGTSEPRTLTRTIMRTVPMHFGTKLERESDAKQFTNVVLDAGIEDSTEITSRLEKLLLQDK